MSEPENTRTETRPGPLKWVDIGLIAVLLLTGFALIPLLRSPGLPNGSDVLYHTYRVAEMSRSWEAGVFFPRWADGLYYGYGSPLWHFYASLSYFLTSIFIRVFNQVPLDALRTLLGLTFFLLSLGMYQWVKQQAGRLAGVLAAAVYLYSPYLIYTEPYARGTYPEMLAFALFPFIIWRFSRLLQSHHSRDAALAALSLFLLIIAHNLMALALTGLLLAWLLWRTAFAVWDHRRERDQWRVWLRPYGLGFTALILGMLLAAYFWLPVLLEQDSVNLANLTGVALLDYRNFFVDWPDLLAPMPLPDLGAINGLRNVEVIGLAQWPLALTGLLSALILGIVRRQDREAVALARQALFFGLMALLLIFLITPASSGLWAALRPLALMQFPWRLLGPALICLGFLAGLNALWLLRLPGRIGGILTALLLAGVIALATPAFTVPEWRNSEVDTSLRAYHRAEIAGLQRGTTFTDEYRPRNVFSIPGPTPRLLLDLADGYPVDRANAPADVEITPLDSGPQHNVWRIEAEEDFTLEVYTFDWPGWTATIDGETVPITPSREHGLITFPVLAGEHEVRVFLGPTAPRILGNTLSIAALILIFGLAAIDRRRRRQRYPTEPMPRPQRLGVIGGILLALIAVVVLLAGELAWLDTPPGESPAEKAVFYNLGREFSLIGYDINGQEFRPGDTIELTLYWYAWETSEVDFSSFVHVSTGGPPQAQADKLHPGGRAISEWWTPEGYIYDPYRITLPETMEPRSYQISVGLYTCELMPPGECGNGYRPPVTSGEGEDLGDTVPLTTIEVVPR